MLSTLFSAVVKPDKPLLYLCDQSTHITNIAICPIAKNTKTASLAAIPPFVTILKLQYEGPVIEGENEEEDDKENVNSSKPTARKPDNKQAKKGKDHKDSDDAGEEDTDEDDDSDFSMPDIEAKEVVVGCFTPTTLHLTTDIYLASNDQYRFVISGSADYEVHLLGRYIPDSLDEYPSHFDSEGGSDDDDMDAYLEQASTDEDDDEESRIVEIGNDDEQASKKMKTIKSITAAPSTSGAKAPKPTGDKRPNKRPLGDKETDADISMADSTADAADGQAKLSKSQRKKLKKAKEAEESAGKAKPAESKKAPEAKEAPKPTTPSTVTLPSGLTIIDTKVGQGADAKPGQSVSMRYIGKLNNGKVFDSNTKGRPFNFKLGRGEVIKGWDEGIKGMKLGGERKLIVPANLAYGKTGALPDIPPNSVLTFEVKLLAVK